MGFFDFSRERIPAEVVGEKLAQDVTPALTREEIVDSRQEFGIPDAIQGFALEYVILICFMEVCVCDQIFSDKPAYAHNLLDSFHKNIFEFIQQASHLADVETFQAMLPERYEKYRISAHVGLDEFVKQAPHDFISFLLGEQRAVHFAGDSAYNWAETVIKIQWWTGLMLKEMINGLEGQRKDYKLGQ
jgi:hypothetical protein